MWASGWDGENRKSIDVEPEDNASAMPRGNRFNILVQQPVYTTWMTAGLIADMTK